MSEESPECPCCAATAVVPSRRDVLRWGAGAGATALVVAGIPAVSGAALRMGTSSPPLVDPTWPVPPIVTRAQWGADESLREPGREYTSVVQKLIVHHTVTPNSPPDPAATLRSVYSYHTSGVYIDLAYNWVIDHRGRIYQGRFAASGDRVGEKSGRQVMGGHTGGFNARSIGIAFLGTHTSLLPTDDAIDALNTLLTWKCARWGIDPLGRSNYVRADGVTVRTDNIMGHRDAKPTTCPGDPLLARMPTIREQVRARLRAGTSGYWMLDADGAVIAFGDAPDGGDPKRGGTIGTFAGIAAHPSGRGYWVAGRQGGVFAYGVASFHGSMTGQPFGERIVDIAPTPSGNGYWLLDRRGGLYTFGDAQFFGSTFEMSLRAPVSRIVPNPVGPGYWILAEDGGVFTFGPVEFYGSTGAVPLNAPITAMAATPTGRGYWLLGLDGGVFTFGDAKFFGSTGSQTLNAPVVDILPTVSGLGYALLGRDGGFFAFGDSPFYGSAVGKMNRAIRLIGPLR